MGDITEEKGLTNNEIATLLIKEYDALSIVARIHQAQALQ